MARDQSGAAVGFYVVAEMDDLTHALLEEDPIPRLCRTVSNVCVGVVLAAACLGRDEPGRP
jgi:hypothetical protein